MATQRAFAVESIRPAVTHRPYLSVVVTARNDDHGGNLLHRMQLFVNGLVAQCERHRLPAELVVVEWNPPDDRLRLSEALAWPRSPWCTSRIVGVPAAVHARHRYSDRLPLFQMIAKNAGIRRARGAFVLATNVDVLFSDELVGELAAQLLRPGTVYRTDRYDVDAAIPANATIDEQLQMCQRHVIRVAERSRTRDLRTGDSYRISLPLSGLPWWLWTAQHVARRAMARIAALVLRPLRGLRRAPGMAGGAAPDAEPRNLRDRLASLRDLARWQRARLNVHTNASGDFTLMSKDDWYSLRGYAELELFSMHIDGLLLYQAHHAGIKERTVPGRVYHLEHTAGFRPDTGGRDALNERLVRDSIPQITDKQFMDWAIEMHAKRAPIMFNEEGWGLQAEDLEETTFVADEAASTETLLR